MVGSSINLIERVEIESLPHYAQRYDTAGDWIYDDNRVLHILVSETGDWRCNLLVGIHELVEAVLCIYRGIAQSRVDAFDQRFERARDVADSEGESMFNFDGEVVSIDAEPGDHPRAPYAAQHCIATAVERMLCVLLGMSWHYYDQRVQDSAAFAAKTISSTKEDTK